MNQQQYLDYLNTNEKLIALLQKKADEWNENVNKWPGGVSFYRIDEMNKDYIEFVVSLDGYRYEFACDTLKISVNELFDAETNTCSMCC
jgi:hypothetical protein